jgi:hypothetical protein
MPPKPNEGVRRNTLQKHPPFNMIFDLHYLSMHFRLSSSFILSLALFSTGCNAASDNDTSAASEAQPAASNQTQWAQDETPPIGSTPRVAQLPDSTSDSQVKAAPKRDTAAATLTSFSIAKRLPGPSTRPAISSATRAEIAAVRAKLAKFPTFAGWQRLGQFYKNSFQYTEAAAALREEARLYRAKKLTDAAIIRENEAAELETSLNIYQVRPATTRERDSIYAGAPLEPMIGCYLGAFIDRDDGLRERYSDENWQEHRSSEEFEQIVQKKHASYFMYVRYGQKFPSQWVQRLKAGNAIPHIAWEPPNLNMVQDDTYLRGWAKAIRDADWPVFIRFAGEMNGFWTPYHKNPKLYREKFRLVHRVLHQGAPRVATIWCVNSVPSDNIDPYYPGDDGCDWVGVNLYSVPFFDNDPTRPAWNRSPLTLLDPIYKKYAPRKPIAICEYAASHKAKADGKTRIPLAIDKMAQLYSALPVLYPRVKLIDWFSMDTMRHAQPGRQLNNYRLTEHKEILAVYRALVSNPYFLSEPEHLSDLRPPLARPFVANTSFKGTAQLTLWVKTYVARPKVYAKLGSKIVYASNRPGAHPLNLDLAGLKGNQNLTVYVYDDKNRFIASRAVVLKVA